MKKTANALFVKKFLLVALERDPDWPYLFGHEAGSL
jgi:hypothetical protein